MKCLIFLYIAYIVCMIVVLVQLAIQQNCPSVARDNLNLEHQILPNSNQMFSGVVS